MSLPSNHEFPASPLSRTVPTVDSMDASLMQAMLENQALKEQIAQQTQLMQLLTHQLATPLTALGGSVALLAEPGLAAEHQQEFLTVVQQQVYRLKHLLRDLMALRHLETGALATQPTCLCLPSLAEAVIADFQTTQVSCVFGTALPLVWGDRWQVTQVLVNLLSNAVKYSPKGSPIEVGAAVHQEDWLNVWVRDRGLGIPVADQPHLFERFYRVQHRDRHDIKGTGLGLSLCKLLVENQGGQLHVESTHGEGSCFSFTLPIAPG